MEVVGGRGGWSVMMRQIKLKKNSLLMSFSLLHSQSNGSDKKEIIRPKTDRFAF